MNKLPKDAKGIPGFPNYYATPKGEIWSTNKDKAGKLIKPLLDSGGYYMVSLYVKGKRSHRLIHQLILETFTGLKPRGCEGCHYNGNRTNNELENLRWDTKSNNQKDAIAHGTHNFYRAGQHYKAILNREQVRVIKHLLKFDTLTQKEIGDIFNVPGYVISNIKINRAWRGV